MSDPNLKLQPVKKLAREGGQTVVEVLIVTVVVATVLTAIAAGLTMSVKNTAQSKQRSLAASYAQETLEVFHREQFALGWSSFRNALSSGTYCLNELPADSNEFINLSLGACPAGSEINDTGLKREAVVTVGAEEISVVSTVSWLDGGQERAVSVEKGFREIR